MQKFKFIFVALFVVCGGAAIYWMLESPRTVVFHPKGSIAKSEFELIKTNLTLMFAIIIPTFILLLLTAWKYRSKNIKKEHDPDSSLSGWKQAMLWILPSIIIAIMVPINWKATRELDPYKPLGNDEEHLTIQVVALDWKWLFIYPEQEIATVNFVQFPEKKPIRFALCADRSPMNSFWIPSLSGQIYAMTGMTTVLHLMAHEPGEYAGKAAEINGEGYARMTFKAKSSTEEDFKKWVESVKNSNLRLDKETYRHLAEPSVGHAVTEYGKVEKDLFDMVLQQPYQKNMSL